MSLIPIPILKKSFFDPFHTLRQDMRKSLARTIYIRKKFNEPVAELRLKQESTLAHISISSSFHLL